MFLPAVLLPLVIVSCELWGVTLRPPARTSVTAKAKSFNSRPFTFDAVGHEIKLQLFLLEGKKRNSKGHGWLAWAGVTRRSVSFRSPKI